MKTKTLKVVEVMENVVEYFLYRKVDLALARAREQREHRERLDAITAYSTDKLKIAVIK